MTEKVVLSPEVFRRGLAERETAVIGNWEKLKLQRPDLKDFRNIWISLQPSARRQILQDCFPELSPYPNSDIYTWAQDIKGCRPYYFPAFNHDDLAEGDNLPLLLETRSEQHPKDFRLTDASSLRLGVWAGHAKSVLVDGMARLCSERPLSDSSIPFQVYGEALYGFSSEQWTGSQTAMFDRNSTAPGMIFWQLEAQKHIYDFLQKCVGAVKAPLQVATTSHSSPGSQEDDQECPSLLLRSSRLAYLHRTPNVDLQALQDLVAVSLADARDDLWLVRRDAGAWRDRLGGFSGRKNNARKDLLRALFGRIDSFEALHQRLSAAMQSSPGEDRLQLLASLYDQFRTVFEERMEAFQVLEPPPPKSLGPVGHKLLEKMREHDPVLYVMGFPAVMRTVDREVDRSKSFPTAMSQTLSDLHVLAVCLQETANHYLSVSDWEQYSRTAGSIASERVGKSRPLLGLVESSIETMVENGEYTTYAEKGYEAFWERLDQRIGQASKNDGDLRAVFAEIQRAMPPGRRVAAAEADIKPVTPFTSFHGAPETTATKVKRARGKRNPSQGTTPEQPSNPLDRRLPPDSTRSHLPRVEPKDPGFWLSLRDGSGKTFKWKEFCTAMTDIGFGMESYGGSAVRFRMQHASRSVSISFHKPHGKAHEPAFTRSEAEQRWLRMLERHVTLELPSRA
ncbi:hypothetical protein K456DRAFT_1731789 [Colletotrichum gloeosporioides 23]|nr:hypothetical protein K456DRAFT_1731789 [Colletotrichum gloeosporioides 23]